MSRLAVPRLVATGTIVTTSTVFRVGTRCARLVTQRTPRLVRLAVGVLTDASDERSEGMLRDELIGLFRDSAEASWLELRRGIDDFDASTRRDGEGDGTEPSRRYRVKP